MDLGAQTKESEWEIYQDANYKKLLRKPRMLASGMNW